jgi:hypothetical protein
MKKIVCKADYLKLHATSEMTDSGNPGVLSQALRDRLRYLVLYLRPFFLSNESVHEATEPAVKASEAAHAQHNGNTQNSLKSPRRIKYFVSFLQFARWLEDFLNRRNCSRGLLLFLFPIICAYSPILDIGPTRSKAS